MKMRDYQAAAVDAAFEEWKEVQSTLCVLPTGAGKSVVAAEIIRRVHPGRSIFVCHRTELVSQAMRTISAHTGFEIDIEKADQIASTSIWGRTPVVIATVQTLSSGKNGRRLKRFSPGEFSLLVLDESHHSVSPSWAKVVNHFKGNPDLKILNLTATPDRADEEALGQLIDSVAYDYEILTAIKEGWLVPVEQQMVTIEGLDFSAVRTTAGDLNGADLAGVMEAEKSLHGIVDASIKEIGDRRTLLFGVSVKQAEMYAEIFNRHKPGMADWVCGKTPDNKRSETFDNFRTGKTQVLCNVGVATEGYDLPAIEIIVMARPTKSRCLYAQMAGRSLRPIEVDGKSIVDAFETADERVRAIAQSTKPRARILDFVGNSGKHKLISLVDILGGKYTDAITARVLSKIKKDGSPANVAMMLEEEAIRYQKELEDRRAREAARKARLVGQATYTKMIVDPFGALDLLPLRERAWDSGRTLSEKQKSLLRRQGIDPDKVGYAGGSQIIRSLFGRWEKKLCTIKQSALLKRFGYETKDLKIDEASRLIDALAKNKWVRSV